MSEKKKKTEKKSERKSAAALRYDAGKESAPRLVAKGFGLVAQRIIQLAEEHSIPVHFDPDLSAILAKLELEAQVPADLYKAVAEVLAIIYRANRDKANVITGR